MNKEKSFTIGRARQCDIVLADDSVSRQHAKITFMPDGTMLLIDCRSSLGTSLVDNQGRVTKINQECVSPLDLISFGGCQLKVKDLIESIQLKFPNFNPQNIAGSDNNTVTPPQFDQGVKLVRCDCGAVKQQNESCGVCQ